MDEQEIQKRQDREDRRSTRRAEQRVQGGSRFSLARSGLLTGSVLAGLLILFAALWRAHEKAQFHQLTTPVIAQGPPATTVGGAEVISLTRLPLEHSRIPEFSSATLLPGLGMQVLQLTAMLAGGDVYPLLAGPTVEQAAGMPAAAIDAAPFHLMLTPAGQAAGHATDVIANNAAAEVVNRTEADGGEATGTFIVLDAQGRRTGVEAKVDTEMNGRSFDVSVRLRNNALSSREFNLSWSPHFAAPGGDLREFVLSVPSSDVDANGSVRHAKGTADDFTARDGRPLRAADMDVTFVNPERQEVGDGPAVRLLNRRNGVVVRLVLLSPSVRSVRVRTDALARTLMLSLGTNNEHGATLLQAGESAEWHVRIDLGTVNGERSGSLFQ